MEELPFNKIQDYCAQFSSGQDDILNALDRETNLTTLAPQMLSGPLQGMFFEMISRAMQPTHILEVGTFTGYASICLARGLVDDGVLDTIEVDPERAQLINNYLSKADLSEKVRLHTGDAHQIIPDLDTLYDIILIDAAKRDYATYLNLCLDRLKPHGLLIFDNTLWSGKVVTEATDLDTSSIRSFNKMVSTDPRVRVVILPLRDGMTFIQKRQK